MAIAIEYFGVAEGAAVDSKGTLTLVGFHPQFLGFAELPRRLMLSVILIVTDDNRDTTVSPEFAFDVNITDPRGAPVAGLREVAPAQEKKHAGLPTITTVVFSTLVEFKRYGEYTARLVVRGMDSGEETSHERKLFIVREPGVAVELGKGSGKPAVSGNAGGSTPEIPRTAEIRS